MPSVAAADDPAAYRFETYGQAGPWLPREWLLTNGTGSFASGTVAGANARRYHGLLVAATRPPVGRVMALSRVAESVSIEDQASPVELSVNYFQHLLIPRGDRYLRQFMSDGTVAAWVYDADGVRVTKELLLAWGRPAVAVRYTVDPGRHAHAELRLQPFVALRDFHAVRRRRRDDPADHFDLVAHGDRGLSVARRELRLHLRADAGAFVHRPDWWYDHTYPLETERGMPDDREDLFTPGHLALSVGGGPASVTLWATLVTGANGEPAPDGEAPDFEAERRRAAERVDPPAAAAPTVAQRRLARAAAQFVAKRRRPDGGEGATVLAGYPYFADWGRDSMVALPGLLLATGRFQQAGQVLSTFAAHVQDGLVPNSFDDYTDAARYDAADASLWFVHAAHAHLRATRDRDLYESLLRPACEAIVEAYRDGATPGVAMDPADGLLAVGAPLGRPTWMDAFDPADHAAGPRQGKAVEVNALWYNALRLLGGAAHDELAARVAEGFVRAFWLNPYRGLADVIGPDGARDERCRPNQIFAVALPHAPLTDEGQRRAVVDVVWRELLTPLGLRSLAAGEPGFRGRVGGARSERRLAYHNGAVWPWLIGPFLDAYLRVHGRGEEPRRQARAWLGPLIEQLERGVGCVGSIAGCFDADPPHRPAGTVAQAWSVAEVLRLAVELEM